MTRVHYPRNPRIQWFDPPVDPTRPGVPIADATVWAGNFSHLVETLSQSAVGAALIQSVRLRTTVYPGPEHPVTDPDRFEPAPGESDVRSGEPALFAATTGYPCAMFFDPTSPRRSSDAGLVRTRDVSLAHELMHAVNITNGNYRNALFTSSEARRLGAPSREEVTTWIVENMYRSERHLPLRGRYDTSAPLPPGVLPSRGNTHTPLHESELRAVEQVQSRISPFAGQLSGIPRDICPYNPFRDGPTVGHPRRGRARF